MKEQTTNTVALPDDIVSVPAFQQLYDYMYTAKLDVQQEIVYPMITASHYLRMPSVLVLCTSYLQENAASMSQDLALQLASLQVLIESPICFIHIKYIHIYYIDKTEN